MFRFKIFFALCGRFINFFNRFSMRISFSRIILMLGLIFSCNFFAFRSVHFMREFNFLHLCFTLKDIAYCISNAKGFFILQFHLVSPVLLHCYKHSSYCHSSRANHDPEHFIYDRYRRTIRLNG